MAGFIPFNRDQAFLRPPDLKTWLSYDGLAHFIRQLRAKPAAGIVALLAQPEATDAKTHDPQALPAGLARREVLKAKLAATIAEAPSFAAVIFGMQSTVGLPTTVLADTGFASAAAIAALQESGIGPLVAIGRTQPHRPYDFRPPPEPRIPRRITEPWRIAMKAKLESENGKVRYNWPATVGGRPECRQPEKAMLALSAAIDPPGDDPIRQAAGQPLARWRQGRWARMMLAPQRWRRHGRRPLQDAWRRA